MLVICANWAITDGTLGGHPGNARAWLQQVHRAVLRGGFRGDGRYRPVDRVDLVFAGDTFDWLTSAAWTRADRPWHTGSRARALRARLQSASVRRARTLLAGLALWSHRGLRVPAADRVGRPRLGVHVPVTVRVAILGGDRDAWLEDSACDLARFGCRVGQAWSDDLVDVRHGAEFDPLSGGPPPAGDRPPTILESLLVDLVARFGTRLLGIGHSPALVGPLTAALAAVGPLEMPTVLAGLAVDGAESRFPPRGTIRDLWRQAVDTWHRAALSVEPVCGFSCCPLDALAVALSAADARACDDLVALVAKPSFAPGRCEPSRRREVLGHPAAVVDRFGDVASGPVICLGGACAQSSPIVAGTRAATADGRRLPVAAATTIVGQRVPDGGIRWQRLHGQDEGPLRASPPLPPVVDAA